MRRLPLLDDELPRPRTRGDCAEGARPCPFVGCRHNNYLDVQRGQVNLLWPGVEPEDVPPEKSCSLDLADAGDATLEDLAQLTGVTRERVRQIEAAALVRIRGSRGTALKEHAEEGTPVSRKVRGIHALGAKHTARPPAFEPGDEPNEEAEKPARISFFMMGDRADELVCEVVWNIFAKDSTANGFDARSRHARAAAKSLASRRERAKTDPTVNTGDVSGFYRYARKPSPPIFVPVRPEPEPIEEPTPTPAPELVPDPQPEPEPTMDTSAIVVEFAPIFIPEPEPPAPAPSPPEEEPMPRTREPVDAEGLTPRMRKIRDLYLAAVKSADGVVDYTKIADAIGVEGATDKARRANVTECVSRLRRRGLLDLSSKQAAQDILPPAPASEPVIGTRIVPRKKRATPASKAKREAPLRRHAPSKALRPKGKPAPAAPSEFKAAIDVLREKLAVLEGKAETVRGAIASLEALG